MSVALIALAIPSCTTNDSKIMATDINPSGQWAPDPTDSTKDVQVMDTTYTVQPSGVEKVAMAKANGTAVWFVVGCIFALSAIIAFAIVTSKGNGSPAYVLAMIILVAIGLSVAYGSVDHIHELQETISKPLYDSLIQKDGNLHAFWGTVKY